ncbi:FAD-dependent 5-carboxymethylaminomethyl-2-thiouridine(34) oxidoreductase MnmC [Duganella sp. LX20W]|uniref:FAD-dependent 5-carboxymethylaminomethyl-2-thiouridine(34) oxidoreductase MnmC n=1 Tax=Rugamonas brunnea TaxID=2758569 RepID=A0A7W2ERW2_9BURK|nr:FAD-dependent 5-carboxymethylaminomethyl-2-thiouridine(34) oxidoreductase MnmC [Rugamonas brunnea]MBA5637476.1 FAD-dependent 5-carboxymethylaminomethyl-2-thiouridine(34) oxidoreductase MnmC [Rugamonas brunnea]
MSARLVVLATDFGDGSHFMRTWAASVGELHYLAIAPRPPQASDISDPQLRALWPLPLPGVHRILLDGGRVTLDLMVGTVPAMLPQIAARVHVFHLPAAVGEQPPERTLARALAALATPGATLHAQAPDEALVWALAAAGFACKVAPQTRDHAAPDAVPDAVPDIDAQFASRRAHPPAPPAPVRRAVVIGAGVAGSAACHRLCARGWDVTLIERHDGPAQEASGNHAGIFMPLLSKDDNIPTRLTRTAYLFALREWQRMGGVGQVFRGASCGVLQLARDAGHARVQREVVEGGDYPPEFVRWLDAPAASALLGSATPHGGWLFGQGGWARPSSLCQAMLDACGERLHRVFHAEALTLARVDGEWQVRAADGALLAQAPTLILANGTGATRLAQAAELPLSALRGQVTHLDPARVPPQSLVVCREAYVTPPSDGVVCAGATYGTDDDRALREACQQENLARLAEILDGVQVDDAPLAGRVGFRCAAPDRLPLAGALPDYPSAGRLEQLRDVPRHPGLYCLLGYASRGIIWAPLMAEVLVSQLEGTPLPLEATLAEAIDPGRFLLKQRRRSQ